MANLDLNSIIKSAAENIDDTDIDFAKNQIDALIEDRAWNMNQPLNMIAYEDQNP